ncbi:MAG: hypothetical protein ACRC62_23875, partial [Microcoleus sp.]
SFSLNSPHVAAPQFVQAIPATANTVKTQVKTQTIPVWGTQIDPNSASNLAANHSNPQVRGIATFLDDRNLVLVGEANQILDILTPEQQQLLSGRIVWEVANSGTQRRQIAQKELEFNLGLESAAKQAKLPPLKRFWELMAWVQASPIALKRNQFGESILAVKQALETAVNASTNRNLMLTQKAIAPATNAIAPNLSKLDVNLDSKIDRTPDTPSFVTLLDRAAANIETLSLPAVSKNTAELTAGNSDNIPAAGPSAKEILEKYARSIEEIIWSSVDYLLGKETAASDSTEKALAIEYYLKQQALKNAEPTSTAPDRPWLKWQDLFGEPAPGPTVGDVPPCPPSDRPLPDKSQTSTKVKPQIEEIEALPEGRSASIATSPYPAAIQTVLAQLKQSLITTKVPKNQPQKPEKIAIVRQQGATPNPVAKVHQPQPTGHSAAAKTQSGKAISVAAANNRKGGVNPEAEWLETKAESMGYVKHPLEQALEWLDRILLRLEKIVEQIWNWAKTNLLKVPNSKD